MVIRVRYTYDTSLQNTWKPISDFLKTLKAIVFTHIRIYSVFLQFTIQLQFSYNYLLTRLKYSKNIKNIDDVIYF